MPSRLSTPQQIAFGRVTTRPVQGIDANLRLNRALSRHQRTRAAHRFGASAYDARFLAAAPKIRTRLVTEDGRLRAAAPALTRLLAEALTSG